MVPFEKGHQKVTQKVLCRFLCSNMTQIILTINFSLVRSKQIQANAESLSPSLKIRKFLNSSPKNADYWIRKFENRSEFNL